LECTDKESVSDSDSDIPVLIRGTEPIIRLRLGFDLVPHLSIVGMGVSSRFRFSVFEHGLDAEELASIYCSYFLYFLIFFLTGDGD
jgi:hypothetical protein